LLSGALVLAVVCSLLLAAHLIRDSAGHAAANDGAPADDMRRKLDRVFAHTLSVGMFENDFGAVQQLLTDYGSAGLMDRAVVADVRGRIVAALAPPTTEFQVGGFLPGQRPDGTRAVPLALQGSHFGQLLLWAAGTSADDRASGPRLDPLVAAAAASALACALLLGAALRRR